MNQDYSFFLFCQLVDSNLVDVHKMSIPYDQLFPIVVKHFDIFKSFDDNMEISEYEAIESYLQSSGTLLAELMKFDEANKWKQPKPKGITFYFDKY